MQTTGAPPASGHNSPSGPVFDAVTASVVERVDAALDLFLASRRPAIEAAGPDLAAVADAARDFVFSGGKRMRPLFAYWGWRCVHDAGAPEEDALIVAAAGLELLHAAALVHDDLIDDSATRRGQPSAHARFAGLIDATPATAASFGGAAAILLGDLLLSWSSSMIASAALGVESAATVRATFDLMAAEMMAGQYLDVLEQSRGGYSVEAALRVARFKAGKYTVERPLLLGAGAAGAPPTVLSALSAFGIPLGEAFQLRDDVLGVFGDPERTGKPAGDDLREGKRTVLVALAHAAADREQRAVLAEGLGNPDLDLADIDRLRAMIVSTGALDRVEQMIEDRWTQAQDALGQAAIRAEARDALAALARAAVTRQH